MDDHNASHIHHHEQQITRRQPFFDCIMEVDLPLGWKPLNMKRYDGTTNPDEHLYVFLTQDNLYTNDDTILCRVFPMSLKEAASTRYEGLLP